MDNILSPNEPRILLIGNGGGVTIRIIEILERNRIPFRHAASLQRANTVAHMNPSISIVIVELAHYLQENADLLGSLRRFLGEKRRIETLVVSSSADHNLSLMPTYSGSINLLEEPITEEYLISSITRLSAQVPSRECAVYKKLHRAQSPGTSHRLSGQHLANAEHLPLEVQKSLSDIESAAQNLLEHTERDNDWVAQNAKRIHGAVASLNNAIKNRIFASADQTLDTVQPAEYDPSHS